MAGGTGLARVPAPVRLHARGARPVPEDAGVRAARISRSAARVLEARRRDRGASDDRAARRRRPRTGYVGAPLVGEPATGAAGCRAGAPTGTDRARRALQWPRPAGG